MFGYENFEEMKKTSKPFFNIFINKSFARFKDNKNKINQ